jgi:hypothetical protein
MNTYEVLGFRYVFSKFWPKKQLLRHVRARRRARARAGGCLAARPPSFGRRKVRARKAPMTTFSTRRMLPTSVVEKNAAAEAALRAPARARAWSRRLAARPPSFGRRKVRAQSPTCMPPRRPLLPQRLEATRDARDSRRRAVCARGLSDCCFASCSHSPPEVHDGVTARSRMAELAACCVALSKRTQNLAGWQLTRRRRQRASAEDCGHVTAPSALCAGQSAAWCSLDQ